MTGVTDFSAKVSRHVSQRLHTSIAPLTEANLYRHTVTSPPSQEAKLKHILGYVELQRELIALEEDLYRSVTEKGHWHSTHSNNNTNINNTIDNLELHSSQLPPHKSDNSNNNVSNITQYPDDDAELDLLHGYQLAHRRSVSGSYHQRKNSSPNPYIQRRTPPPVPSPALYLQQQQQQSNLSRHQQQQQQQTAGSPAAQRHLDSVPDGLDPTMALPRALPRSMTHHDQTLYRDSFYSGIGQENDWQQLEELDPDSLAGIHLYGDTSDLQPHALQQQQHQQRQQQPSPAAASSPLNKYPTYEYTPVPAPRNSDWQHEHHLQQLQQQAILRQLQYPDDEGGDDAKVQLATRHHRQHSISQAQQLQFEQQQQQQRQLASPPPTFIEKEKKAGRFSSRFSFLTRRRQPQHQRHDSMPATAKDSWLNESNTGLSRLNSLSHRRRSGQSPVVPTSGPGATTPVDDLGSQQFNEESYPAKNKSNSRVKQMFRDVFGISKKKDQSPDLAFRDISLPSTHIRSPSSPLHHHHHQQHLDPSINSQHHYSTVVAQRKGLVTPVSRPDTAQSSYRNGVENNINTNGNNKGNINTVNKNRARESLVDPVQQLGFQKMELDEDCDQAFPDGHSIMQTSLTPPPASSVLRHSNPPHRSFPIGSAEYEPVLITSAAVTGNNQGSYSLGAQDFVLGGRSRTRPSSQMPSPKDYVDSGCDSTGGHDQPYTTASNATTLNPLQQQHHTSTIILNNKSGSSSYSQQQQQQQQQAQQNPFYSSPQVSQHQKSPSYDYDRAMTMSTYDNGPTIVSMAQVQKVDLEGLRQMNHHLQHTPPSHHSHHLGMVAVESPFA
ncbi:hypothetical protein BGX33_000570 [Mortierella sp. NVP41]|nr:hypothetical protein BGX33_000570 [Mortierella sp. NVP41]